MRSFALTTTWGKAGVQGIHDFRRANAAAYEPLFSSEHVARIDVVMKEKGDCAGRAGIL